jgi:hypothetical protein
LRASKLGIVGLRAQSCAALFAALDVLKGRVIGRCMQRHPQQEFIRFLNAIEAQVPIKKTCT